MRTIAIAAQKGGVGKTTLTTALAVEASKTKQVAILDADPQGSLSRWWNVRECATPHFISCELATMRTQLKGLERGGMDFVFIDTPPAISHILEAVINSADLVLVPVLPTQDDLDSIRPTLELIDSAGAASLLILNRVDMRTLLAKQAYSALAQVRRFAPAYLSDAQAHPQSRSTGQTAAELNPNSKAACEVAALWKCVLAELRK